MAQGGQSHRDRPGFSESLPDRHCFPSLRPSMHLSSWVWQSPGAWHKGRCTRRLVLLRSQTTISTLRAGGLSVFLQNLEENHHVGDSRAVSCWSPLVTNDYLFDFVSSKVMVLLLLYLNHEYNSVDKKEELKDRGRNVGQHVPINIISFSLYL